MGNQSGSTYGGVFIRTDKPFYFAGDIVTGNIYLNIIKVGFPGRQVLLKMNGKEKCQFTERKSRTIRQKDKPPRVEYYNVTHKGKTQFYQHRVVIWTFDDQNLPVGQYTFPFQFQLVSHLPGSYFETGSEFSAKTAYTVQGEVLSFNKSISSIKHEQEFIIREPLKTELKSLCGEMQVHAQACCSDDGVIIQEQQQTSHVKCVFDKNCYMPGDTAYLLVDIDNTNCQQDIETIQAKLTNYLILTSNNGKEKNFTRVMSHQSVRGVKAGVLATEEQRKSIQLILMNEKKNAAIKPTSNGQLVRSVYRLSVETVLSGQCCGENSRVEVPIKIIAPIPQNYNEPVWRPQNWNPQVFQPQIVSFTERTMYVKNNEEQQKQKNQKQRGNQFENMIQHMN